MSIAGKCQCGKNQYEITGEPEFQFICYCSNCRVLNSAGHLCGMVFDKTKLVEAKHTQTYRYEGGSGSDIVLHFCPVCSVNLYAYPTEHNNKVVIRANTLVDSKFNPQASIFTDTAFSWDTPLVLSVSVG